MTTEKSIAIVPRTVDEARSLSRTLAPSALLPAELRGKEADVLASIMAGQELGLPPMAALRGVHIVKGKPVLAADTMVGCVLGSGLAEYFVCRAESAESVTYETKRRGSPHAQSCTWTMRDAQTAGLGGGDNWRKYPRAMLKARCKAMLARDVYPDVLAGCYDPDEARDFGGPTTTESPRDHSERTEVADAEVVSEVRVEPDRERTADDDLLDAVDTAEDQGQLDALIPALAKLKGAARAEGRKRYAARKSWLVGSHDGGAHRESAS